LQKEVFRNTCWWDEVSLKCKDFLPTPNVYHWHPVAFVENMRETNRDRAPWMVFALEETKKTKGVDESKEPLYSMIVKCLNHVVIKDEVKTKDIK